MEELPIPEADKKTEDDSGLVAAVQGLFKQIMPGWLIKRKPTQEGTTPTAQEETPPILSAEARLARDKPTCTIDRAHARSVLLAFLSNYQGTHDDLIAAIEGYFEHTGYTVVEIPEEEDAQPLNEYSRVTFPKAIPANGFVLLFPNCYRQWNIYIGAGNQICIQITSLHDDNRRRQDRANDTGSVQMRTSGSLGF
ncbi:MAG: hypothetical protein WCT46_02930 [Candidatus Gracilibacteria bacterium]